METSLDYTVGNFKQDDNKLLGMLDRGIDDMGSGRELPLEDAFQKITDLRENWRKILQEQTNYTYPEQDNMF